MRQQNQLETGRVGTGRVPQVRTSVPPDFLSRLMALAHFMRLSLMKAAHAAAQQRVCHPYRCSMARKFRYSDTSIAKLLLSYVKQQVPCGPEFPVKLVGVDELHAAFLNESRTRGR
jgi:hypothetical protein